MFARGHAWLGVRDFVHGVTGDTVLGVDSKFAGRSRGHGGVFSNICRQKQRHVEAGQGCWQGMPWAQMGIY